MSATCAALARDGGAVLLVDAGDMWQARSSRTSPKARGRVGVQRARLAAAAIGNHELISAGRSRHDAAEPGPDPQGALKARAAEATFPFLAANLIDRATGRPVAWTNVRPSVIVKAKGTNVGIVGILTAAALTATGAANVTGLTMAPLAERVIAEARALRAQGATIVLVASHAGGRCTRFDNPKDLSSCDNASEIFTVARALPAGLVDVILAGHVHQGMAHEVNGHSDHRRMGGARSRVWI
jgi:5'-nucleotidase